MVLLPHLLFTLSQRYISDHLVQPVKFLYLCKYLFCISAASTFKNFCYLHCLSFNDKVFSVQNIGPPRLQNTEVAGKGYQRGQETRYNPKPNKQQQNLQPWKSGEVQFSVNPYLTEMVIDIHLQKMVLMKTVITAVNVQETVYWNAVSIFVHFYF